MEKIGRRSLSLLLCMAMVLSIMPGVSLADRASAAESTYNVTVNVEIPSGATTDAFFVYGPLDNGVTDATAEYEVTQNADGEYTATVPTTGKYLVILSYSTTTSGSSGRPNTRTTYYYGKQIFFVTKEQTTVAMAVEEVNISWTDAKEIYDDTVNSSRRNYFDHIDVRVYGTLSTSEDNVLTTYNIKLANANVTVTYPTDSTSGGVGFEASHVDNNNETYEWRATEKQIYEDAIVTLTCDILDNNTNEVLYEDFSISFSGEIEFTQAIINCDMNRGLDFIVSPTTIIEVIYNDVNYDWNVQGSDTDLNATLLAKLNEIATVPAPTTDYRVGALHTVDTFWTEGTEELVCIENADGTQSYYILTFHGWDEYTNEEGTYTITGDTIEVNSDTTVSGYWTYQAYDAQNSITLTKTAVIPAGYEDHFDPTGMHLTITKGTDTHLDISFSHMASHMVNGAEFSTDANGNTVIYLEYTLMLPVYTEGMSYTIVENNTDVPGFTCDRQITVDGQTLSTDGTSVAYAELPADTIDTDLGAVNFINTYSKPAATPSYNAPDLTIRKTDKETANIMAGVVFSLIEAEYDEASGKWLAADGAAAVTATTTTQGVATFAELAEGAYLLQETITQENYILDDSVYLVQVTLKDGYPVEQFTDGQWINVYEYDLSVYLETAAGYEAVSYLHNYLPIGNQKAYGNVTVTKEFGSSVTVNSVVVNLLDADRNVVGTVTLDASNNWTHTFTGLEMGTYYVEEQIAGKDGYTLETTYSSESVTLTVSDPDADVTITNTYIKQTGNLTITKRFGDGNQYVPASVTIRVTGPNGFSQDVVLSADNNGTVTLTGLDLGTYTITELNAEVDGYKLETTYSATEVTVTNGATISVTVTNTYTRQVGSVTVEKTFGTGNEYIPESIEIEVLDENGNVVRTATLSASNNWAVTFANLPLGTYTVLEVNANADGFILTSMYSASSVTITATENTPWVTITNTYKKAEGSLIIYKDFGSGNQFTPDSVIVIVLDENEKLVHSVTLSADNQGTAKLDALAAGVYYIYEQDASVDGYDWVVSYTGGEDVTLTDGTKAIKVTVEHDSSISVHITNTYTQQVGNLTVNKVFGQGNEFTPDSVGIDVLDANGNWVGSAVLNEGNNWSATFTDLPIGTYTVVETNAAVDGYNLTTTYSADSPIAVKKNETSTVTITNTYIKRVGSLTIVKQFGSNEHPESVTVVVTGPHGFYEEIVLNAANNWRFTLEKLVPGTYTVTEQDAPLAGYDWAVTGATQNAIVETEKTATVTITNTYVKQVGSLTIHKYFGTGNQYTPASVTVLVTGPNNYSEQFTLNAANGWTVTLPNLDLGVYTVQEVNADVQDYDLTTIYSAGSVTLDAGNRTASISITNTYKKQFSGLTIEKVFGAGNELSISSVTVIVTGPNGFSREIILSSGNNWSVTLTNLELGTYSITEKDASVFGYDWTVTYPSKTVTLDTGNRSGKLTVSNTYTKQTGTLNIEKVFGMGSEYTPESVTVVVTGPSNFYKEIVLSPLNGWAVSLTGLKLGTYYITEKDASVNGYDWTLNYSQQSVALTQSNRTASIVITNTYSKQICELTISKTFGAGNEFVPESVLVMVYNEQNEAIFAVVLDEDNNWTMTITNLKAGTYTIVEKNANVSGYDLTTTYSAQTVTLTDKNRTASVTVTNTYTKTVGSLVIEKVFGDGNDFTPESVTMIVTGPNGYSQEVVLNLANDWTATLTDLELGKYTVTEKDASVDDYNLVTVYSAQTVTVTEQSRIASVTVTNTYIKHVGSLTVNKLFGEANAFTPESVTMIVTGPNGYTNEVVLNNANGWSVTLENLDLGNYTVAEKNAGVDGYDLIAEGATSVSVKKDGHAVITITNTYVKHVGSLTIEKIFGTNNAFTPESVTMIVTSPNGYTKEVILNAANGWTVTLEGLDLGEYTVTEKDASVNGYDLTVEGSGSSVTVTKDANVSVAITNTYIKHVGSLTIEKIFGANNAFTPESVTMIVTGPNGYSKEVVLNAANGWSVTLDNLDLGEYTVTEQDSSVNGYDLTVEGSGSSVTVTKDANVSVAITNTYIKQVGSLTVNKVFGEDNAYTPESVTMIVTGPNNYSKEAVLNAANGWSVTLENLELGEYTVTEQDSSVNGYDLIVDGSNTVVTVTKNANVSVTITNTYIKQVGNLTVNKLFGANNAFTPDSVTMVITGPNGYYNEVVLNATNGWTVTLENLEPGEYTVTEIDASVDDYYLTVNGNGSTVMVTKNANASVEITNTYVKHVGSLTVNKAFGEGNAYTPDSITMVVTGPNGYSKEVILNAANGWTVTLENLEPGEYTVTEKNAAVDGYSLVVTGDKAVATVSKDANTSVTITNTYTKITIDPSPDTADSDALRMGLIILMIALCGMMAVIPHGKKENA